MDSHARQFRFKAQDLNEATGEFTAYVSIFGNVDDYGDRVLKGAFVNTIAAHDGGVFPIVYSHQWGTVPIGLTKSAEETETGLLVKGVLLIADNAKAREVYACFKAGVPMEFSFSYLIKSSRFVTEDGQDILELLELDIDEVGPCLIGANRETHLVGVKSRDAALAAAKAAAGAQTDEVDAVAQAEAIAAAAADHTPGEGDQTSPQDAEAPELGDLVELDPLQLADVSRWAAI